jgi:hypothetical protein
MWGEIFVFLLGLIVTFPSLIYRWSLKSTALIWSPLLWVIVSARTIGPVHIRLDEICNDATFRIMRGYSAIIAFLFFWKITILLGWQTIVLSTSVAPYVEPFLEPARLPIWQVATAINSALSWLVFFLAQAHLRAIASGNPNRISEIAIKREIAAITVIRNVLALYTIACTLYIAWQIAKDVKWPAVEFILFPWS